MLDQQTLQTTYASLLAPPCLSSWTRFCSKVCINARGCWEWQGAKSHGYGCFHYKGKPRPAHVLIMLWQNGAISSGTVVDHFECDNRGCVNPQHLKLATA